jgi:D-glycero-alpha-D-manno-heptose 1-phosphate guanylyltransferase
MEAVILAGGFGTRLRSVVPDLPKPMAPVAGRPFLEILLHSLAQRGVQRVVLSLGYRAELIQAHFGTRFAGIDVICEVETQPLGTGGALLRALHHCDSDVALVVNGDTFLDFDLGSLSAQWQAQGRPIIIGRRVADTARYGHLRVAKGVITAFEEKGASGPGLINTGHYLLPTNLLAGHALPPAFSFESDFIVPRLGALGLAVFETDGLFIDIGIPEDYRRAQAELAPYARFT